MNRKTNKTAHVLRLLAVNEFDKKENPILNEEFKDEVILHKSVSEAPAETLHKTEFPKAVGINVISEIIDENLDAVLDRFRVCAGDKCKEHITIAALNYIKPQYVPADSIDAAETEEIKEKYKSSVMSVLVRFALQAKNNLIQ